MKKTNIFFLVLIVIQHISVYARNPFEFADAQLKKYTPIKIEKIYAQEQQLEQKWRITEACEKTQIVEDIEGNVRAISLCAKN